MFEVNEGSAAQPPGLVTSHTSGTPEGLVELDPALTRLRRLRRSVLTAARMHEFELTHQRFKPAMLTLTYRRVDGWHGRHISDLLQRIRVWLRRRGHGAVVLFLSKESIRRMERDFGRRPVARLSEWLDAYKVRATDGTTITVGHRTRRVWRK